MFTWGEKNWCFLTQASIWRHGTKVLIALGERGYGQENPESVKGPWNSAGNEEAGLTSGDSPDEEFDWQVEQTPWTADDEASLLQGSTRKYGFDRQRTGVIARVKVSRGRRSVERDCRGMLKGVTLIRTIVAQWKCPFFLCLILLLHGQWGVEVWMKICLKLTLKE